MHYSSFIAFGVIFDVLPRRHRRSGIGEDDPERSPNQVYFQEPTQGQPGKPSTLIMLQPICSKLTYVD